jgi:hypothetical protein
MKHGCLLYTPVHFHGEWVPVVSTVTTREKPSSSAGLGTISSAGTRATVKALQLKLSSSAFRPVLLLYLLSSSAVHTSATAKWLSSSFFLSNAKERYYYIFTFFFCMYLRCFFTGFIQYYNHIINMQYAHQIIHIIVSSYHPTQISSYIM